jgi:hypothetical protein
MPGPLNPTEALYCPESNAKLVVQTAAWISASLLILTLITVILAICYRRQLVIYICAAFWAVVPPIWFWAEYFFLYRVYGNPGTLDLFKYGQDTSKAIWAGVALTLGALAASSFFKRGSRNGESND